MSLKLRAVTCWLTEGKVMCLSFLISQEHCSCFFRSEGKDPNHRPAFGGWGLRKG